MGSSERRRDRARTTATALRQKIGSEIRIARRSNGLSLRAAGEAVSLDFSTFARIERGLVHRVTLEQIALACAAVGLEPSLRTYPRGDAVRDAPQMRLLERLRGRLPPQAPWATEVPMPISGDLRGLDALTRLEGRRIGFEAETQLFDLQASCRKAMLKKRDAELDVIVLVVADTVANRRILGEHREALRGSFPLDSRPFSPPSRRAERLVTMGSSSSSRFPGSGWRGARDCGPRCHNQRLARLAKTPHPPGTCDLRQPWLGDPQLANDVGRSTQSDVLPTFLRWLWVTELQAVDDPRPASLVPSWEPNAWPPSLVG